MSIWSKQVMIHQSIKMEPVQISLNAKTLISVVLLHKPVQMMMQFLGSVLPRVAQIKASQLMVQNTTLMAHA